MRLLAAITLTAASLLAPQHAGAETIFAVTTTNGLLRFDSASPEKTSVIGTISGLIPGEAVVGIDFRPATGQLFGLSLVPVGPTFAGRLSLIDTTTAAATPVGATLPPGTLTAAA